MFCVDIWEKIAEYLDLSNLINLAYVCVDARTASHLVYKKKNESRGLVICVEEKKPEIAECFLEDDACSISILPSTRLYGWDNIWIKNCEESLRFLRNFGRFLPEVIIEPYQTMNDRQLQKIIEYINEFGTESRNTIILRKYSPFLMENPLKNVYKAAMYTAEYSINEFNILFPDLQSLHIHSTKSGIYMKQQLPKVKELYIDDEVYHWKNEINDEDILLAMELNPQIQKLAISNAYSSQTFKLNVNDRKIKLISKAEKFQNLFQIIRPEKCEEMYVDSGCIDFSPRGFIEKFINLKSLTMIYYQENLEMLCKKIPKLQVLQVIYRWSSFITGRDIGNILASTAIHSKLSKFSIHFNSENERKQFYIPTIQFIDTARWQITMNEDGPKRFRFSIVLNKIQDM